MMFKSCRIAICVVLFSAIQGSASAETLDGHFTEVRGLHFSKDGSRLLSHSRDHTIIIWDLKEKKPRNTLRIRSLRDVVPLPGNEQFLLIHRQNQLLDWDGKLTEAPDVYSRAIAVFPGGISLRRGEEKTELVSGERVIATFARTDGVFCISSDGRRLGLPSDKALLVRSLPDMKEIRKIPSEYPPQDCAFTPDGKRIAAIEVDRVSVWAADNSTPGPILSTGIDPYYGGTAVFSPDGMLLALESGDRITFWDLQARETFRMASEDITNRFNSFAYSPAGGKAAIGKSDGTVLVEPVSDIRGRERQARRSGDYKPGYRETMDKLEKELGISCDAPPCNVCEKGNCQNGSGTLRYNKRETYTGEFKDGKRHGKGEFQDADSRTVATWRLDGKNGPGEIFHSSGARTIVSWLDDLPEGPAVFVGRNGDELRTVYRYGEVVEGFGAARFRGAYYYGFWKNGVPQGSGRIVTENMVPLYEGLFLEGYPAENMKLQPVGRIVDAGVFSPETPETFENFGLGEPGSRSMAARVRFTQQSQLIPARLGVRFGIRVSIKGVPEYTTVPLRIVIIRPGLKTEHTIYEMADAAHVQALAGFVLRQPEDLAKGTWTFQVYYGETLLAKQDFLLTEARP
jgi:WD40 repeat protein